MTDSYNSKFLDDSQFQSLLVGCLESLQRGETIDRHALARDFPKYAEEIGQFLSDRELLEQVASEFKDVEPSHVSISAYEQTVASRSGTDDFAIGETIRYIGEYEILEEIARGGMGVVFRARQQKLKRIVALKMILAGKLADTNDIERFQREARAAGRLKHPAIVPVHEIGEHEGRHYFTMDFVEGQSLGEVIRDETLSPRKAAQIVKTVAEAVQYAHQEGIVHRDLKPANVLLDRDRHPHVTDFGLARMLDSVDEESRAELTASGQILGTPSYMSPEQASGKQDLVGPASDIYSLGAILYACLTGRAPFVADSPVDTLLQVMKKEPVSPRALNPSVPKDLETICLKCLTKEPHKRYGTALELADDLQKFMEGRPVVARPIGSISKTARWCRRNKALAALLSLLFLSMAVGTYVSARYAVAAVRHAQNANRARAHAETQQEIAEEQRRIAVEQQQLAEESELTARRYLYISDLQLALQAWEANNIGRVVELLTRHEPREGQVDLRSFEWHYLHRLVNSARAIQTDHEGGVYCVRYSHDGGLIVSTGLNDKTIRVRDGQNGKTIAVLKGHTGLVYQAIFSLDSRQVISCSKDKTIRVWDIKTATETGSMKTDLMPVRVVRSADGRLIAVAGSDGIEVWSLETRQRRHQIKGGFCSAVTIAPDGKTLAYGSVQQVDGEFSSGVVLWDLESERETAFLSGHAKVPLGIVYSDDGTLMATCSGDGTAKIWRLSDQKLLQTLQGHGTVVADVAMSPDKARIVTAGNDKTVRVWDTVDGRQLQLFKGHSDIVYSVDLHPDGHELVSGSKDGSVRIWKLGEQTEVEKFRTDEESAIRQMAFLSDGHVVTGSSKGTLQIWNPSTGQQTKKLGGVRGVTMSLMSVRSDEPRIAACGLGSPSIELFSLADESRTSVELEARGLRFAVSPDATQAAAVDGRGRVSIVDLTTGEQAFMDESHQGPVYAVTWHPNGRLFATGSYDTTIRLWDASSRQELSLLTGHELAVVGLAFNSDGSLLASGSASAIEMDQRRDPPTPGTIRLWDLAAAKPMGRVITGHSGGVLALTFSPDDRTLVSASHDATVRLWDPVTGSQTMRFAGDGGRFWSVTFSTDGTQLAAGADNGSVSVWSATRPGMHGETTPTAD